MIKLSISRFSAAWYSLVNSYPLYKWRIARAVCPNCNRRIFITFGADSGMTRCLYCTANATTLALIPVVHKHMLLNKTQTAWEMSSYGAVLDYLTNNIALVIKSEFFQDAENGVIVDGILNVDAQNIPFEDNSLDLITSSQVFEHVPNDILAYKECYRVLKKGGALIFTVPLYDYDTTLLLAEIIGNEIIYHFPPEYHGSRATGNNSVLTFWHHSINDICERVNSAGFVTVIKEINICHSQKNNAKVIYAIK